MVHPIRGAWGWRQGRGTQNPKLVGRPVPWSPRWILDSEHPRRRPEDRPPYRTPKSPALFFSIIPHPLAVSLVISFMDLFIPRRPRLRHATPGWVENPEFFITICCKPRGLNQLCHPHVGMLILEALRYYHSQRLCQFELLVLMPDHLHGILRILDSIHLAPWVHQLKHWLSRKGKIRFQENFFDHRLRSLSSASQKWKYVNMNPVRAGYTRRPEDWPYRFTANDFA